MQWALRSTRPKTGRSGGASAAAGSSASGFIYIEPSSLRRSAAAGGAVASPSAAASADATMYTTAASLARAFGIVVRQIADLLTMLQDYSQLAPSLSRTLEISYQESIQLQLQIEYHMKPNWEWLMSVMDSTEAQLRFGTALSNNSDPSHPGHPLYTNSRSSRSSQAERTTTGFSSRSSLAAAASDNGSNRRDFLSYALSLMRAHNAEHSDSLPVLDVSAMKHIAYVFDSLIYYMRSGSDNIDTETPTAAASGSLAVSPHSKLF